MASELAVDIRSPEDRCVACYQPMFPGFFLFFSEAAWPGSVAHLLCKSPDAILVGDPGLGILCHRFRIAARLPDDGYPFNRKCLPGIVRSARTAPPYCYSMFDVDQKH